MHSAAVSAVEFQFDDRSRTPDGDLGRAVASAWYARGTIPYRRERVAPTGSTVGVIVLGDPILETAGGPRAQPLRADHGFLIGSHDRPVINEPTGETFARGIVTTPVGARAALGVDPRAVAGAVVDLESAWGAAAGLRERLLAESDPEAMLDLMVATLDAGLDRAALADPGAARCKRAIALLEADPVRPIGGMAAELGVSHGHLDREMNRMVGLGPRRLARPLRVERLPADIDLQAGAAWADLAANWAGPTSRT